MLSGKDYRIDLITGQYENRFFLNFRNIGTGIPEYPEESDMFRIYSSRGILKLEINNLHGKDGTLVISNLTGQIISVSKYNAPGYYELNPGLKNGICIASFLSGAKRSSKKIYIQN